MSARILLRIRQETRNSTAVFLIVLGGTAALRVRSGAEGGTFQRMKHRFSARRRPSWPAVFLITGLAAISAVVLLFERCTSLPTRTAAVSIDQLERLGRDARSALIDIAKLQPRITINDRVYFEQKSEIGELALVSQRLEVEHEFLHTWAGSSKRLRLHGTFTAKAGFDLHQEISLNIHPEEIAVRLPHAQILGVEQNSVDVLAFENGFWNPISGADVQSELAALAREARQAAIAHGLPAEAERALQAQLAGRLKTELPIHVSFYDMNTKK